MAMTRTGSQAIHSRPETHDAGEFGQVLPFRRPGRSSLQMPTTPSAEIDDDDDFAQYEQERDRDEEPGQDEIVDYRQRMLMNLIALAVVAFLVGTGVWLADTIAKMEINQDCFMQGRVNCTPMELAEPRAE